MITQIPIIAMNLNSEIYNELRYYHELKFLFCNEPDDCNKLKFYPILWCISTNNISKDSYTSTVSTDGYHEGGAIQEV